MRARGGFSLLFPSLSRAHDRSCFPTSIRYGSCDLFEGGVGRPRPASDHRGDLPGDPPHRRQPRDGPAAGRRATWPRGPAGPVAGHRPRPRPASALGCGKTRTGRRDRPRAMWRERNNAKGSDRHETQDIAARRRDGASDPVRHRARRQGADAAVRSTGEPDAARSRVHDGPANGQPWLRRIRSAVRHQREVPGATTDGGGPHAVRRRPDLYDHPARGPEIPQRRAGARPGLRAEPCQVGEKGDDRADGLELRRCVRGAGRPHHPHRAQDTDPHLHRRHRPRRRLGRLHDARASGENRSVQADPGHHRLRSVPLPQGRVRQRPPPRPTRGSRATSRAGSRPIGPRAARSRISTGSSGR